MINSNKMHFKFPLIYYHHILPKALILWIIIVGFMSSGIYQWMDDTNKIRREEVLVSMCDQRARMLQDQFNVSVNHVHALALLVSTFHYHKNPSAIDQDTFSEYTARTAFERPLLSGVAYAEKVVNSEREMFERQHNWVIKTMDRGEPSPVRDEYAPVIFFQDSVSYLESLDMMSGEEDRENILRARETGKAVLTSPFRLLETHQLGVVLTVLVYNSSLPENPTVQERIDATAGYLGGVFHVESLVENLLGQLADNQAIVVHVYDITNASDPLVMYGNQDEEGDISLSHESKLDFGDPFRKHKMRCRYQQKAPIPLNVLTTVSLFFTIGLLVGYILYGAAMHIVKVEDHFHEMQELKVRAEAADVAKSQFLATVSHEIRTPMHGILGMLHMLMDTELDVTQQDHVRTAQENGKALVSLINEVLDQAKIESGKLELEDVRFDLRGILDDVLSLFSGKSQQKGVELAVYISERVPEMLIGDPGRFRQILNNLMSNSIKFTEKGHIFVTVHLVEELFESTDGETASSPKSTLSGLPVADRQRSWEKFKAFSSSGHQSFEPSPSDINLIVSVEDTGIGIPLEAQSRIFTPFMQVGPSISRTHGGTGIGLSISKFLVGLMKGEIGFSSTPKIGSTFTFTVVFSNGMQQTERKNEPQNNNQAIFSEFRGMKAVVVDHRPARAKVSWYHLQRLGIQVEVVPRVEQALHYMKNGTTTVNMILIEQEIWNREADVFIKKLQKDPRVLSPKSIVLANSAESSISDTSCKGIDHPMVIVKPLRASMIAATLQRGLSIGNGEPPQHKGSPAMILRNLLLGRKFLIVDDNKVNLRVAAGALKKYGADVVCAESGIKAISLLKPPHEFDACFMDIQMPGMDGFEATQRIREMEKEMEKTSKNGEDLIVEKGEKSSWHLPVLAMTADVIQATHEECLKNGMDGYVSKPFEAEQLYRVVSRFFNSPSDTES